MRLLLALVATLMVALGLWMITATFLDHAPKEGDSPASGTQIRAVQQPNAGPLVIGTAIMAGGVVFFIMLMRR